MGIASSFSTLGLKPSGPPALFGFMLSVIVISSISGYGLQMSRGGCESIGTGENTDWNVSFSTSAFSAALVTWRPCFFKGGIPVASDLECLIKDQKRLLAAGASLLSVGAIISSR